jgi:hypothetical protein
VSESHVSGHRMITAVITDLWREMLPHLTPSGLAYLHSRLSLPGEFIPDDPRVALLALDVDQALADAYGNDLADVPGREVPEVEDFYWPRPEG